MIVGIPFNQEKRSCRYRESLIRHTQCTTISTIDTNFIYVALIEGYDGFGCLANELRDDLNACNHAVQETVGTQGPPKLLFLAILFWLLAYSTQIVT